ncbi:metallophosphoesterase family protein [Catellatospora tritici]|uniref:metallophosphoesterase family protein n=1 Tax=Catellatospora tritici TaxID=2851566 RepID=UPI001C2DDB7A|nr:metallophosphoesterase [Catellatospora tritici]MBV1853899.1 metallophosphoesterase [Catellatospora tritici]
MKTPLLAGALPALVLALTGCGPGRAEDAPPDWSKDPVLVGAGDIATSGKGDSATAALLDDIGGTVFTLGDNAYDSGTAKQFDKLYGPTWGRHKSRTRPAPGNHDYRTPGATGYYDYFGAVAGPPGLGYYSFDLGTWHIVSLNSNVDMTPGSAQERWLRADLAASGRHCTLAYWHHPLFTSGANHAPDTATLPLYQALYDSGAEVVVAGHNHQYERFAPMDPTGKVDQARGLRTFVVGTGGGGLYQFGTIQPNSEVRDNTTFGVIAFTLHADSYEWRFIPEKGKSFTDTGTGTCH